MSNCQIICRHVGYQVDGSQQKDRTIRHERSDTSTYLSDDWCDMPPELSYQCYDISLTNRHNDLTSRHNYLTSDGRNMLP